MAGVRRAAQQSGRDGRGERAVGDVLTGVGVLVHLGTQVSRIHLPDRHRLLLDGEHPAQCLEGGLGRTVGAPTGIGLGRGVGGDVDEDAVGLTNSGKAS